MDEEQAIDTQIYALIISLITVLVSLALTYNQKLEFQNKDTLFSPKTTLLITKGNRITTLIVSLIFLYVNIELYKISKKEGEDLEPYILQIISSILVVISSVITLYVILNSDKETVSDIENPIV